jgi:8-oxo-dGTP pyrophosphatase MutT (NUDIX family)
MTESRPREFASAILIDTQGRHLLQQRDNVPGILYPGMVTLFGGHREGEETFLQCVCREVREEISYLVPPERFEWMSNYSGVDPGCGGVVGAFFIARNIPVDALRITEGSLLVVKRDELQALLPRLVPSAWSAVRLFTTHHDS